MLFSLFHQISLFALLTIKNRSARLVTFFSICYFSHLLISSWRNYLLHVFTLFLSLSLSLSLVFSCKIVTCIVFELICKRYLIFCIFLFIKKREREKAIQSHMTWKQINLPAEVSNCIFKYLIIRLDEIDLILPTNNQYFWLRWMRKRKVWQISPLPLFFNLTDVCLEEKNVIYLSYEKENTNIITLSHPRNSLDIMINHLARKRERERDKENDDELVWYVCLFV